MEDEQNVDIETTENNDDTTDNASDSDETTDIPTVEDYETLKKEKEALAEKNKQLFERAKKAEQDAKKLKSEPPPNLQTNEGLTRDEAILISKGVSEEELELAKVIQAGKKSLGVNITLTEIYKSDPAIQALKEKRELEEKKSKASLGASNKGSNQVDNPINKQDLSREEHKKLWEQEMAKLG